MKITVIGIGLIGGSLALAMRQADPTSEIWGVDASPDHGQQALDLGLIDRLVSLEEGILHAEFIILATPVNYIATLLPQILDLVDHQVVIDVGSTKEIIMQSIVNHPIRGRYVGTHPMAGTELSGPTAALADLFLGKRTVIVDSHLSDPDAVQIVEDFYDQLKMEKIYLNAHEHDMHTAYVSHISHISSFALALTVLEKEKDENRIFELAGGGFGSTVRLADSNPDTWVPIFEQNRDHVLDVLDEHINTISQFRTLLIKKDFKSFYKLIERANQIKKIVKK